MEADAARAFDKVASILGRSTNFSKPEKISGHRTPGADDSVTKAVKAAHAFLSGDCRNEHQQREGGRERERERERERPGCCALRHLRVLARGRARDLDGDPVYVADCTVENVRVARVVRHTRESQLMWVCWER